MNTLVRLGRLGSLILETLPHNFPASLVHGIAEYAFDPRLVARIGKGHLQCTLFLAVGLGDHVIVGDMNSVRVFDSGGHLVWHQDGFCPGGIDIDELSGTVWFTNRRGPKTAGVWALRPERTSGRASPFDWTAPSVRCTSSIPGPLLCQTMSLSDQWFFSSTFDIWTSGLAWHATTNTLYVCERSQRCLCALDASTGRELWVLPGAKYGLEYPTDCLISQDGSELFVSDWEAHSVFVFDVARAATSADGALRRRFGQYGSGAGEFRRPTGLAWFHDCLLVSDSCNDRICALLPANGTLVWSFPVHLAEFKPWGVDVDSHGRILVCGGDSLGSRLVHVYEV